ncbi:sensor histidine kinase [Aquifex aeolicus]|uniref:histidine kinase n=1 Tax=Aquifex aeolicus (strain VF5) TaxID=224324 RepID=O67052_AQUAE|nr:PAS domain-containing sensor histidine kinase [Aquifex aeolicus]AAC07011.1 histidine kinase sensor protein [Aquifex aeolicus VF5]
MNKLLLFLALIILIGVNIGFFLNLKKLPDANYPFILIAINVDLLFLLIISAVIFRKLIKVYLGKAKHRLRRKLVNVLIFYIFVPLFILNIFSAFLIFQTTREFLSGKIRDLIREAELTYRELQDYRIKDLYEKREILKNLPEEKIKELDFVKGVFKEACNYEIKETKEVYYLCLGDKYVLVEKDKFPESLERFGGIALDLRSLTKVRDIVTGIYAFLMVSVGLLTLLATVWLAMLFARYVSEPLEELTEKALEISKGNLNVDIKVEKRGDEIEELSSAFLVMKENLRELYEKLKQEKEALQRLLDALPVGVLFKKNNGNVYTNKTFNQMFGKVENLENFLKEVKSIKNLRIQEVDQNEGKIYIFEDITPIVLAERFKVWRESVKRIAHEIKNPLTPIKLNLGRILRQLEKEEIDKDKLREIVKAIYEEVERINNLINQFRSIGRERELKPERISLKDLIQEVSKLYKNAGISIKVHGDKVLLADRELLKEVFYNLINNSIEHGGKEILIEINT